jgi:hypothetical protein
MVKRNQLHNEIQNVTKKLLKNADQEVKETPNCEFYDNINRNEQQKQRIPGLLTTIDNIPTALDIAISNPAKDIVVRIS